MTIIEREKEFQNNLIRLHSKMITIGITTAPRSTNYLHRTLDCLKGYDYQVFAEPGSEKSEGEIRHEFKRGLLRNWDYALNWLIDNSETDHIAIFQDDIIIKNFKRAITELPYDIGFASLYTPVNHKNVCKVDGWNRGKIGWGMTGACALIFTKASANMLVNNPKYIDHFANYGKDQQIDAIVGQCMLEMKMDCYWYNPSLVEHIGKVSTTGHIHDERISAAVK